MADKKITQLTNITGANLVDADEFVVVDISADETKAITLGELKEAFDSGSGFVRITGDTMTGDLALSGADVTFGDNDKAIFGAGSDLQIYHSGTNSDIDEVGTGNLRIGAENFVVQNADHTENMISAVPNGQVVLYYDNSIKFNTSSTGVNITGTLTSDGLTVDQGIITIGQESVYDAFINSPESLYINIDSDNTQTGRKFQIGTNAINTSGAKVFTANDNGDISFYEDTGTTPKFFWDASAERLGIGTASPATSIQVAEVGGTPEIRLADGTNAAGLGVDTIPFVGAISNTHFAIKTNNTERMRITSGGNVGIGTSSPSRPLDVNGSGIVRGFMTLYGTGVNNALFLNNTAYEWAAYTNASNDFVIADWNLAQTRLTIDTSGNLGIGTSSPSSALHVDGNSAAIRINESGGGDLRLSVTGSTTRVNGYSNHPMLFYTNNTERMRIDSGGHLMVGGTSNGGLGSFTLGNTSDARQDVNILTSTTGFGSINFADGTSGADRYRGYITYRHDGNYMQFATDAAERMRIDSSGNLLVGTTNSSIFNASSGTGMVYRNGVALDVAREATAGGQPCINLNMTGTDGDHIIFYKNGNSVGSIGTFNGYPYIGKGDTNLMMVDAVDAIYPRGTNGASSNGNISLGGTGDRFKDLYLSGSTYLSGSAASTFLRVGADPAGTSSSGTDVKHGTVITSTDSTGARTHNQFRNPNGEVGSITTSGSATAYNTSSDYRLKTDAQPMTGASARVQALNPVNFEWIAGGTRVDGFLAHEAQEVVPEAVTGTKDAMRDEEYEVTPAVLDDDGNVVTEAVMGTRSVPDYQGIDQSKLVPLLTAALQEALTKIDALETRITALEG